LADPTLELRPDSTRPGGIASLGVGADSSSRARRRRIEGVDPAGLRIVTAIGLALVVAETVTLLSGPTLGLLAWALVLCGLLVMSLRLGQRSHQRVALSFAVLPLVRILSLALPAAILPMMFWYLEIGLASFEAILLVMRRLDLSLGDIGVRRAPVGEVLTVGAIGAFLGVPAYLIVGSVHLGQGGGILGLVMASAVVIVFVGVLEEVLFRGLIQSAGTELMSRGGVVLSVAATTLMYAATLNLRYIVFMALVATFFGIIARRSGSIAAPIAGHAALAWVQLLLLPMILS
jgi:membrane protease YdiL (CAAX protease family)